MTKNPDFDLETTVNSMRSDFLQCRDFGHAWRPFTARWVATERAYETQLRCSRCKTIRVRWIGQRGEQIESRYQYTDGYTIKGMGRLTGSDRDLIRLASVLRVLPEDADEEAS